MAEAEADTTPTNSGKAFLRSLKAMDHEELLAVLTEGFCNHCAPLLETRIFNLIGVEKWDEKSLSSDNTEVSLSERSSSPNARLQNSSVPSTKRAYQRDNVWCLSRPLSAEICESDETGRREGFDAWSPLTSVNTKQRSYPRSDSKMLLSDGLDGFSSMVDSEMLEEQNEQIRFLQVGRKKDFTHIERIDGKSINVLRGLELHTKVFNAEEQKKIVEFVYHLQHIGQKGHLRERTYTEPRKWMRGKGRVTLQFGCCYNYAVDKNGNPPGIIRDEEVDPLPSMFKNMIKRMIKWDVLPPTCIPNSCIVNIYDEGDCIPPHIDHHDFLRPFCTVSFLSECNILFGSNLKIVGPGEFSGPVSIPLPLGSVLILNGNGADVAKHCVPAVPKRRISITFRKMDDRKLPYRFTPDSELMRIKPMGNSPLPNKSPIQQTNHEKPLPYWSPPSAKSTLQQNQHHQNKLPWDDTRTPISASISFIVDDADFPALGSANSGNQVRLTRPLWRQ